MNLTTVRQEAAQIAELVVEPAIGRLNAGRTDARAVVVDPTLIVRGTSGPPVRLA